MKYYLIKIEGALVNVANKQLLCNYEGGVELTEEDIENCLEGVEHFQDRNMEVPDTFNKIRKVLE